MITAKTRYSRDHSVLGDSLDSSAANCSATSSSTITLDGSSESDGICGCPTAVKYLVFMSRSSSRAMMMWTQGLLFTWHAEIAADSGVVVVLLLGASLP